MKYIDKVSLPYGSIILTDCENLCESVSDAIYASDKFFRIINPLASGRVDSYNRSIKNSFKDLLPLCKYRLVYFSSRRIEREESYIDIGFNSISLSYDYSFLFDDIDDMTGKKVLCGGVEQKLIIWPDGASFKEYFSKNEYLNSKYESGDISARYNLSEGVGFKHQGAYKFAKMIIG